MAEKPFKVSGIQYGSAATEVVEETTISTADATTVYQFSPEEKDVVEFSLYAQQGSKKTAMKGVITHDNSGNAEFSTYAIVEAGNPAIAMDISAEYKYPLLEWTQVSVGLQSYHVSFQLGYGNGVWFFGSEYGAAASSTDTLTWTTTLLPGEVPVRASVYGPDPIYGWPYRLFGIGSQQFASSDAISWVSIGSIEPNWTGEFLVTKARYLNNSFFVCIEQYNLPSPRLFHSTDAAYWTSVTWGSYTGRVSDIAYGNGVFVAVGSSLSAVGPFATSTDGTTWTNDNTFEAPDEFFQSIAYGNGKFITVGYNYYTGGVAYESSDGIAWTSIPGLALEQARYFAVAHNAGRWVVVNNPEFEADSLLTSTDSVTWTTVNIGALDQSVFVNSDDEFRDVVFGGDKWVTLGKYGEIITSYGGDELINLQITATDADSTPVSVKILPTTFEV